MVLKSEEAGGDAGAAAHGAGSAARAVDDAAPDAAGDESRGESHGLDPATAALLDRVNPAGRAARSAHPGRPSPFDGAADDEPEVLDESRELNGSPDSHDSNQESKVSHEAEPTEDGMQLARSTGLGIEGVREGVRDEVQVRLTGEVARDAPGEKSATPAKAGPA